MTRQDLKHKLETEVARWSAKTFQELVTSSYPVVYESGVKGQPAYYSTEVTVLDRDPKEIHLSISVDDGGFSTFVPVSSSIIIAADAASRRPL